MQIEGAWKNWGSSRGGISTVEKQAGVFKKRVCGQHDPEHRRSVFHIMSDMGTNVQQERAFIHGMTNLK